MAPTKFLPALAVLMLASSPALAHISMAQPVPYSADKVDTGPLGPSDYPCKQGLGFTVSEMNEMAVGSQQTLSFGKGQSAVHGGGSCQLAVTLDKQPTAQSKFKVIHSILGGCPGVDGSPATFNFVLPAAVPSGEATFAWTWFARLSGLPEMYMNCAPIRVTGGAADTTEFDSLPDLFLANIPQAQCTSPPNKDTEFPNPGASVVRSPGANLAPPTGSGCGSPAANTSPPPPLNPGGIFAPVPGTGTDNEPAAAPPSISAPPSLLPPSPPPASVLTTLITRTATASPTEAPALAPAPAPAPAPPPASNLSLPYSAAECPVNGTMLCNGDGQFGLCSNGRVIWQPVAPGTACHEGRIVKRGLGLERHMRRALPMHRRRSLMLN